MAKKKKLPSSGSFVIANNDIVYLWWSFPNKIDDCLGFSIRRIVEGKEDAKALPATVGFSKEDDPRESPQTTDEWPIQSFNWKDLYAPHDRKLRYRIVPMVGSWEKLTADDDNAILTDEVTRTQDYGSTKVIFNRGLLSTQAFSKSGGTDGVPKESARELISDPSGIWRKRLGGQMLFNFHQFFAIAGLNGGRYLAALYELTDTELIDHLLRNKGNELILSNANSSKTQKVDGKEKTVVINDGTNAKVRKQLHKRMKAGDISIYDRMLGSHIGHNKFVIYLDKNDKPKAVLTGSTNWTATGLCGQTNNLVIIESDKTARQYLDYWNQLKDDANQDAALRQWCGKKAFQSKVGSAEYTTWYSPNTKLKSKPKKPATPVDMKEVYELIVNAKKSILFLVFNPGAPSILEKIKEVSDSRKDSDPLFVRGAISDAKIAKRVVTEIYSNAEKLKDPDRYYVLPKDHQVTGVAAIPGKFSYWEKELLKLGFSTIHDKILVIDPFGKDCAVVTGSHNLGYKASYTNDENMLIIRKDTAIAKAYAAHILDIVNHFKWRYKLQSKVAGLKSEAKKREALASAWQDLDETDKWMDYYYSTGYIDQYRLFLR
jgi:phosphatidylserine/phosphatidylglycerophosphate/cardiolipin synthase-like enzyme